MADILVAVVDEVCKRTGRTLKVVSHGIDLETDKIVVMSGGSPESMGAVFDMEIGEYIIRGGDNRPSGNKPRN
jgi:hypothetical protein